MRAHRTRARGQTVADDAELAYMEVVLDSPSPVHQHHLLTRSAALVKRPVVRVTQDADANTDNMTLTLPLPCHCALNMGCECESEVSVCSIVGYGTWPTLFLHRNHTDPCTLATIT